MVSMVLVVLVVLASTSLYIGYINMYDATRVTSFLVDEWEHQNTNMSMSINTISNLSSLPLLWST